MELKIPKHIAIIMDGNGRWAEKRMLARSFGHREGVKSLRKTLEHCATIGVEVLTVYAFSTENWKRPQEEVDLLMKLFSKYMKSEKKLLMEKNIRFCVSGKRDNISKELLKEIEELEELTKANNSICFNIAFNYGGRTEIVDACNKAIKNGYKKITEEVLAKFLYNDFPEPDLVIRTGGEYRISNFLLWQIAYSELFITDVLWPDFNEAELMKAISDYNKRERRFGGIL